MESNKVKLPKEVAEAITEYQNDTLLNNWKGAILKVALEPEKYIKLGSDEAIKEYVTPHTIDIFLQALVNGYEVEQTPEDKVRGIWGVADITERNAIRSTLNAVGIKISGVND